MIFWKNKMMGTVLSTEEDLIMYKSLYGTYEWLHDEDTSHWQIVCPD